MSSKDFTHLGRPSLSPPSPQQRPSPHEEKNRRSYSPPRHEPSPSHPKRHTSPRLIIAGVLVALAVVLAGLRYIGAATPLQRSMGSILPGAAASEIHAPSKLDTQLDPPPPYELHARSEAVLDTPALTEEELLEEALNEAVEDILREGENPPTTRMSKEFPDLIPLLDLPAEYVPVPASYYKKHTKDVGAEMVQHKKRLIVVGDIHGMLPELEELLFEKLKFNPDTDHLVCAGDMISKGPDSVGVVRLLMKYGASAVRGNHEDRVLLANDGRRRKALKLVPESMQKPITDSDLEEEDMSDRDKVDLDEELGNMDTFSRSKEYKDRVLAKKFSDKQVKWLGNRPVILKVGEVDGLGTVVVCHGGIVPGIKLDKQDPYAVMNMRTIDLKTRVPSEGHKGVGWTKLFNRWQARVNEKSRSGDKKMTVIYGHDSRRGLAINDYTKGIDSGCLKGGKLTAFVMEGGGKHVTTDIVHVDCKNKKGKRDAHRY